jgi:hypothetical protein
MFWWHVVLNKKSKQRHVIFVKAAIVFEKSQKSRTNHETSYIVFEKKCKGAILHLIIGTL